MRKAMAAVCKPAPLIMQLSIKQAKSARGRRIPEVILHCGPEEAASIFDLWTLGEPGPSPQRPASADGPCEPIDRRHKRRNIYSKFQCHKKMVRFDRALEGEMQPVAPGPNAAGLVAILGVRRKVSATRSPAGHATSPGAAFKWAGSGRGSGRPKQAPFPMAPVHREAIRGVARLAAAYLAAAKWGLMSQISMSTRR